MARRAKASENSLSRRIADNSGIAAAAAFLALSIVIYISTISAPFVFDSEMRITRNPTIRALIPPEWATYNQRPLAYFTFAVNHALHGLDVRGYHLTNVAIHAVVASLLFGVVSRLMSRSDDPVRKQAGDAVAFVAAALWLVHPLQTQAVVYHVQRIEALMAMLVLGSLYSFVRSFDSPRPKRWLAAAVLCCYLGVATKEVAAMAPLLLIWCDRAFFAESWSQLFRKRGAFHAATASSWLLLAFLMASQWDMYDGKAGLVEGLSSWEYLRSQPLVLLHYLRLTFWPAGQCLDYGWPVADQPLMIYAPGAVILILLAVTGWLMLQRPKLGFIAGAFFVILAPTSSILPIADLAFEHRMYLPLASITTLTALLLFELLVRSQAGKQALSARLIALASVLAVPLAAVAVSRSLVYLDVEGLWKDVIAKAPNNPRGHLNLANAVADDPDRLELAEKHYEQAIELNPDYGMAHYNYGVFLGKRGDDKKALAMLDRSVSLQPKHFPSQQSRASALIRMNRPDEAAKQLEAVLAVDNRQLDAHVFLGAHYRKTDPERAARHFRAAIALAPDSTTSHTGLAAIYWRAGQYDNAIRHYRAAARAEPQNPKLQQNLAAALAALKRRGP